MKTLTKLALAAVLAVGVMATFSSTASAKDGHGSHHGSHHHKHHGHNASYKKHHHHHGHHHHGHHHHKHHNRSVSYGFGSYIPSRSFGVVYIPVEIDFLSVL